MNVTIRKTDAANQSFGRGSDNTTLSARWAIYIDGTQIGFAKARPRQAFAPSCWEFYPNENASRYLVSHNLSLYRSRRALVAAIEERLRNEQELDA
jgi:hypothetical protein